MMSETHFFAAMYLRLSRDDRDVGAGTDRDGHPKSESDSIGNQRKLIRAFISEQQDIELYDSYIDDGYSGSNFDRPEFQRMMSDIEVGRVNLVIVKDLSRFGRDYIETGRYLQKIFPALGVRFIALNDRYDSLSSDEAESGLILPFQNFINDSYCRDISMKVKSQFEVKRKNGEYIAPFALYGYKKATDNKNQLVVDAYAAQIVRRIFAWKIEGAAVSAIAEKLNKLGILSPKEYKKSAGISYKGGFSCEAVSKWSSSTVKRILTNEMYLGHMVQGKTEKVNYKLNRIVEKPQKDWIKVENTHEPIVGEECFRMVQNLLKADGRVSPVTGKNSFFSGILFCADCEEQMIRREKRYICSTKNRGEGCSRHSIPGDVLKELVTETVKLYANCFMEEKRIAEKLFSMKNAPNPTDYYDTELIRLKKEQEKYRSLCLGLYEDFKEGIITKEEMEGLRERFAGKAGAAKEAQEKQRLMREEAAKKNALWKERIGNIQECPGINELDRHTLCSMIKRISVFENRRIEIEFCFTDRCRRRQESEKRHAE